MKYKRLDSLKENFSNFIVNAENLNISIFKLNSCCIRGNKAKEEIESKRNIINQNQKKLDLESRIIRFEFDDSCEDEKTLEELMIKIIFELTWLESNASLTLNEQRSLQLEKLIREIEVLMKKIILHSKKAA